MHGGKRRPRVAVSLSFPYLDRSSRHVFAGGAGSGGLLRRAGGRDAHRGGGVGAPYRRPFTAFLKGIDA
mgnify:CR=1 FL=1